MTQALYPQALADASVCIASAKAPSRRYRFLLNGGCCRGQNGIVRSRDRFISLSLGVNEGLSIARFTIAKRERKATLLFKLASVLSMCVAMCMEPAAGRQYEEEGAGASENALNAPSVPQR